MLNVRDLSPNSAKNIVRHIATPPPRAANAWGGLFQEWPRFFCLLGGQIQEALGRVAGAAIGTGHACIFKDEAPGAVQVVDILFDQAGDDGPALGAGGQGTQPCPVPDGAPGGDEVV